MSFNIGDKVRAIRRCHISSCKNCPEIGSIHIVKSIMSFDLLNVNYLCFDGIVGSYDDNVELIDNKPLPLPG